jgi:hypothetical protein
MSWFGWGSSKKEDEHEHEEGKEVEAEGEEDEVIGTASIQTGNFFFFFCVGFFTAFVLSFV